MSTAAAGGDDRDSLPILVVGAGLTGSMIALALAQRGFKLVIVEARGDPRAIATPEDSTIDKCVLVRQPDCRLSRTARVPMSHVALTMFVSRQGCRPARKLCKAINQFSAIIPRSMRTEERWAPGRSHGTRGHDGEPRGSCAWEAGVASALRHERPSNLFSITLVTELHPP